MSPTEPILPRWSDLLDTPDPADSGLDRLTESLAQLDGEVDRAGTWPEDLWSLLVAHRAPAWSLPSTFEGEDCDRQRLLHRYARVAEGSLTAAFILSQHDAGVRRLVAGSARQPHAHRWLERIADGTAFTTVGISHLTTSRRLGERPMVATPTEQGYSISGIMPWVTAACRADVLVTGAPLDDGRQILVMVPVDRPGIAIQPAFPLAALQASCTAEVICERVLVTEADILAGPASDVMAHSSAAGTGGLETSAIALGQARAAIAALQREAPQKFDLNEPVEALVDAWLKAWQLMVAAAQGGSNPT
ncbi:MAG: acyl-CoA dehydrogenase family protein, partial [Isosphaeraceae bacterium]